MTARAGAGTRVESRCRRNPVLCTMVWVVVAARQVIAEGLVTSVSHPKVGRYRGITQAFGACEK